MTAMPVSESPIEELLLQSLRTLFPLSTEGAIGRSAYGVLVQQHVVGPYRLDFGVWRPDRNLNIEADGRDFHDRTPEQAQQDRSRDRSLALQGWQTIRYSGSEIRQNSQECANEIGRLLSMWGQVDSTAPIPVFQADVQTIELARVRNRIGPCVLTFCQERYAAGASNFHADDLRRYVIAHIGVAPSSPDRILRDLRQKRVIGYTNTNRRESLYRIDWVDEDPGGSICLEGASTPPYDPAYDLLDI